MDVVLDNKEVIEPELKVFTENRVKFSLKRLFLMSLASSNLPVLSYIVFKSTPLTGYICV
jgi:hypothetical protein